MAVIGISYCKIKEEVEYNNLFLVLNGNTEFCFYSGNLVKDWYETIKKFIEYSDREIALFISKTVEHFLFDTEKYKISWLVPSDDNSEGILIHQEKTEKLGLPILTDKKYIGSWNEFKTLI